MTYTAECHINGCEWRTDAAHDEAKQAGVEHLAERHPLPPDTPCAGCPSPILPGAPRFSEVAS